VAEFRPDLLLRVLARHGVDYVVIGGIAAALHGSDLVTFDVDITPALGSDNLSQLSAALHELHARVRSDAEPEGLPFEHNGESLARATTWNLTTDYGDLDLSFVPAGTRGYDDLRRAALSIEVAGTTICVAALADVVRSKQAAARPKDLLALPVLRRLLEDDAAT
jgi:hypothetical protein